MISRPWLGHLSRPPRPAVDARTRSYLAACRRLGTQPLPLPDLLQWDRPATSPADAAACLSALLALPGLPHWYVRQAVLPVARRHASAMDRAAGDRRWQAALDRLESHAGSSGFSEALAPVLEALGELTKEQQP